LNQLAGALKNSAKEMDKIFLSKQHRYFLELLGKNCIFYCFRTTFLSLVNELKYGNEK